MQMAIWKECVLLQPSVHVGICSSYVLLFFVSFGEFNNESQTIFLQNHSICGV